MIIEAKLPEDPIFCPRVNVRLFDTRLGGFSKPLVGMGSIDLSDKIPWCPNFGERKVRVHQLESKSDVESKSDLESKNTEATTEPVEGILF